MSAQPCDDQPTADLSALLDGASESEILGLLVHLARYLQTYNQVLVAAGRGDANLAVASWSLNHVTVRVTKTHFKPGDYVDDGLFAAYSAIANRALVGLTGGDR